MMAENVIETNKSNDIDVDKIQARNVQTFAQKLKQYKNHPTSLILYLLVWLAAIATMATVVFLIGYILVMGIPYINADIFSLKYTSDNCSLVPALVNTILMTLLSLIVAVPLGIFSAIYLVEYAKRGNKLVSIVRTAAETLQGIPSIVYGLFGMLFFVEALHWGYSLLAGSFTVAIMILPLIMRTTEEALLSVTHIVRVALDLVPVSLEQFLRLFCHRLFLVFLQVLSLLSVVLSVKLRLLSIQPVQLQIIQRTLCPRQERLQFICITSLMRACILIRHMQQQLYFLYLYF